jgi:hypothetical protein
MAARQRHCHRRQAGWYARREFRFEWVEIPGRAVRFLYIGFTAPEPLRHDMAATLGLIEGGGKVFALRTVSRFSQYERPETQGRSTDAQQHAIE